MAASPEMRRDLRVARSLGLSLREFHGDEPAQGEARYDEWERSIWRAYHDWEADLCKGCGRPRKESLLDTSKAQQTKYEAGFFTCLGCLKILKDQDERRIAAQKKQRMRSQGMKHPEDAPGILTGHEQWEVWPVEPKQPTD